MIVRDLIERLRRLPPEAYVHLEVYEKASYEAPSSSYGHALGVTCSEPNVVVISNRLP